mmetsp:Transcript_135917/g.434853  ORF Transcript_135917/g.434853 Transcript_135917/m.434853 type:complete len:235 (+) Transcript_135917:2307-3011(+)
MSISANRSRNLPSTDKASPEPPDDTSSWKRAPRKTGVAAKSACTSAFQKHEFPEFNSPAGQKGPSGPISGRAVISVSAAAPALSRRARWRSASSSSPAERWGDPCPHVARPPAAAGIGPRAAAPPPCATLSARALRSSSSSNAAAFGKSKPPCASGKRQDPSAPPLSTTPPASAPLPAAPPAAPSFPSPRSMLAAKACCTHTSSYGLFAILDTVQSFLAPPWQHAKSSGCRATS